MLRLYAQLWDEDEAMMVRRQAMLDARVARQTGGNEPASVSLGSVEALRARLPFVLEAFGEKVRVLEIDGALAAYPLSCPHLGGPLEAESVEDGCITCPWHGYRFDLRTGRSVDGRGLALSPRLRVEADAITSEVTLCREGDA
jgi:nitrite reductase/ring-hydroxylating ferredoxin subunit